MHIRLATTEDLPALMAIFHQAQKTIAQLGIDQWQDGYPTQAVIQEDIHRNRSFLVEKEGEVCATFVLMDTVEPTYNRIYEGHWLTGDDSKNYTAIHRVAIAVEHRGQGIAESIMAFAAGQAKSRGAGSLRIDTHSGNIPMRAMLEKNGFTHCGRITLESGAPRVAYEKPV